MKEDGHVSGQHSQDKEGRRAILRDTRKKMVEVEHFQINNELDEERVMKANTFWMSSSFNDFKSAVYRLARMMFLIPARMTLINFHN